MPRQQWRQQTAVNEAPASSIERTTKNTHADEQRAVVPSAVLHAAMCALVWACGRSAMARITRIARIRGESRARARRRRARANHANRANRRGSHGGESRRIARGIERESMEMTPIPPLCTQIHVIRIAIRVICVVHDVIGPRPRTSEPPPARRQNGKYGLLKGEECPK